MKFMFRKLSQCSHASIIKVSEIFVQNKDRTYCDKEHTRTHTRTRVGMQTLNNIKPTEIF